MNRPDASKWVPFDAKGECAILIGSLRFVRRYSKIGRLNYNERDE